MNPDRLLYVWKNIMTSIGKIHEIKNPVIHSEVIQAIVIVWDVLDKVLYIQAYSVPKIPSLTDFMGIIFRACMMPP
jgi:hypothetical protein